jgi:hypothetical protein
MNILSYDSRSPGRDLNLGPSEYEAVIFTTRPRHSVTAIDYTKCPPKNIHTLDKSHNKR